ncbi:Pectate lyase 19 precursor [Actinidia chinensis var. chinensis]|uniref:Pectate lyase 19 n=1 Tax=Actinidia chinensis var. chinensis TaxID=1590841 RepID=A0A2R6RFR6_ACTCC|nr:Pectate lyase 19 precursor [Actinidia chinensis var. chinensis]
MDNIDSRSSDLDVDLESGGTTSEEDGIRDPSSYEKHVNKLLGRSWNGLVGPIRGGDGSGSNEKVLNPGDVLVENVEIVSNKLGPEMLNLVDKKMVKDKRKKTSSTVPSKPPRPPRGPSLDAADIKLVREFSELAALKRKRVERMKSLRKRKVEKASSCNSSLFAMVVTILFCLVIIFQGLLGSRV